MERDLALHCSQGLSTTFAKTYQLHNRRRQATPSVLQWRHNRIGNVFQRPCWERPRLGLRGCIVKSDMTASATPTPAAPLLLETPSGQFLAELLQSHPHLLSAAAEQQLEALAEAREEAGSQEHSSCAGNSMILYKRIAEIKARERRKSLEDIMYALICQRFLEAGISFIPQISTCSKNRRIDTWLPQDEQLESVHSEAALELIFEHLSFILGGRGSLEDTDQNSIARISKLRMGRAYAASALYGYFIRRVDKRFQLERTVANFPAHLIESEGPRKPDREMADFEGDGLVLEAIPGVTALVLRSESKQAANTNKRRFKRATNGCFRTYVMSFDQMTLQRYANLRSKGSANVIERHTEALFGKPKVKFTPEGTFATAKDEVVALRFSGLKRLVLEAVAFGSFLWDVESYVDAHYNFAER